MPTYVYRREDGTTFEVFQRISDDALTHDPDTGQSVERVIGGGAGLIFKGTGFYETDYVRKTGSESTPSKSASPSDPAPSTAQSGEAKSSTPSAGSAD